MEQQTNMPVTEAKAVAKSIRITARKLRLVADLIRGKGVKEAQAILKFTPNGGAAVISKVLKSATANAVNNFNLDESKLYVKTIFVDEAMTMKRFLPRAKGSASGMLKRSSHITVVVAEK